MRRVYQQSAPYMARPAFKYYKIDAFKGADFSHNPTDVDISRSPFTLNMVRYSSVATVGDETTQGDASMDVGAVRKRMGYESMGAPSSQPVNHGFGFNGEMFVHSQNRLWVYRGNKIKPNQPDGRPTSPTDYSQISPVILESNGVSVYVYGGVLGPSGVNQTMMGFDLTGYESWTYVEDDTGKYYTRSIPDGLPDATDNPSTANCLSSHFRFSKASGSSWGYFTISGNTIKVWAKDSPYADATEFENWVRGEAGANHPVQFCYTCATPSPLPMTAEEVEINRSRIRYIEVGGTLNGGGVTTGWEIEGKYYLVDGQQYRMMTAEPFGYNVRVLSSVTQGSDIVYVPTVAISRKPGDPDNGGGGGEAYEDYNLIGRRFTNAFCVDSGTAAEADFYLTDKNLGSYNKVEVLGATGNWVTKVENTDYTFTPADGLVHFTNLPGESPVTGLDNVRITAALGNERFAPMCAKIDKCTVGILYGVAGLTDRLFLSGNPDFPSYEWYSAQDDPTYFPDMNYSVLGDDCSAIVGYSIINDRLVAHKSAAVDGRNAVVQYGQMIDGKAQFPVVTMLRGEGAVSPKGFAFLRTEPLFVTARGISAITSSDVLGEKYSQIRSSYINGRLLRAPGGLSGARAIVFKDLYLLFVGQRVYVLDGLQKAYAKEEPYSNHQYEGYYWLLGLAENENVTAVWEFNNQLWFGTSSGRVYAFYTDPDDPASYNDNGNPISAIWDTPYLTGNVTYNRKTFRYLGVTMQAYPATSLGVAAKDHGKWVEQWEDGSTPRYFDISDSTDDVNAVKYIDFENFSFSVDTTQITVHHAVNVRFVDKTMFRLRNNKLNQPFVLYDAVIEYQETGKM